MMEVLHDIIGWAATLIEILGVFVIAVGIVISFICYVGRKTPDRYTLLRQKLGRSILLGLELLVAADIISTIVTEPTLDNALALAVIVLIRTFLSLSIQVELDGKWPWHRSKS